MINERAARSFPDVAILTIAAVFLAQGAAADDYFSPTDEHLRLSLGAMHVSSTTSLRADSSNGMPGTVFNGENEFGLDKSDWEPRFETTVRVATRHRLAFDYFTLDRTGNADVGATPINFRDVQFLPGDLLQTSLKLRTFGMAYEYSFWHSEQLELSATIGVHATDISSMARVETQSRHIVQTEDQAGPVPTVGLDATYVASTRFYLEGRAQYLNVHVKNLSGSFGVYEFNALYRYRANIALGVGYNEVRAHLASTDATKGGMFDFDAKGPQIFFRAGF